MFRLKITFCQRLIDHEKKLQAWYFLIRLAAFKNAAYDLFQAFFTQ